MQKNEWWKDFFSGLVVDMWRIALPKEHTKSEADFIFNSLEIKPQAKVLDVPCGYGRLTLELASRALQMTGVDISQAFLLEARKSAEQRSLNISWEEREMRDLPWKHEFDGAFCFGNSFGYLDDDGNAEFLKSVSRTLKPGARFVLDAGSVAEAILPRFQERTWSQFGDILFLEEQRYDHVLSRLDTEYTLIRNGKSEKKVGSHRIYTYREICHLLENSGFGSYEAFGSPNRDPFKFGSPGLLFVAVKK